MFILFTFLYISYVSSFSMRVFSPGEYTLKPSDYNNESNIVVEIWGAGGSAIPSPNPDWPVGCGGSGAYIKASLPTNLKKFKISVGRARNGTRICSGEDSFVYNNMVNLTAGGGQGYCNNCSLDYFNATCGLGGRINSILGVKDVLYSTGNTAFSNGICSGASAPYGGKGGIWSIPLIPSINPNGTSPGGGGATGYAGHLTEYPFGMGGDGAVIIYF